jgi:hypothetical protein
MLQGLRVVLACSGVALQNRKSSNERICVATSSDRSVISFGYALRWNWFNRLPKRRCTMSAVAEVLSSDTPRPAPRASDMPDCPICADSLVAAEGSAFSAEGELSYLWSCETCGYGFVTRHAINKAFVCN